MVVCLYFTTKFLGAMKLEAIVLGLSISFLAIHWMPAITEGVYWYNGAINYGFFYFVLQLCICALVEYTCCKKKEKEIIYFLISSLLVFVLEGGNHVTAFIGLLFTFFLLLIAFISKRKEKIISLFAVSVVGIGGFLLNVMSPGTRIRAGAIGDAGFGVVDTIYMALRQVVFDIREWIGVNTVVVLLCVFPILVRLAKEIRNNSGFTFKYPVLLPVFSVLILGAMYCPPFYAMGMAGDGRLIDIVYYSFTLLLFVCVFYFTGWLLGKFDNDKICVKTNGIMIIVFSVLIYISMVSGWSWGGVATSELCEGVPQAYSQQAYQRDVLFRQSEGTDLEIEMFNDISEVIFFRDITEDESFWRNKALARYYNLNSIRLDTDNE